jgi:hypothetical protein
VSARGVACERNIVTVSLGGIINRPTRRDKEGLTMATTAADSRSQAVADLCTHVAAHNHIRSEAKPPYECIQGVGGIDLPVIMLQSRWTGEHTLVSWE